MNGVKRRENVWVINPWRKFIWGRGVKARGKGTEREPQSPRARFSVAYSQFQREVEESAEGLVAEAEIATASSVPNLGL